MIDEILVSFLIIFFYLRFRLIMNFQIVDFNQIFSQSEKKSLLRIMAIIGTIEVKLLVLTQTMIQQ